MGESGVSLHNLKRKNLLLCAFCAITFILGFEAGGLQLALLRTATEFNLDGAMLGLPITVKFAALCATPLIFGPIADRIGKKIVIAIFMVVFSVGSLLIGTSGGVAVFLFGLLILGAGSSVCECMVTAATVDIFGEDGERRINLSQSFFCLGAAVSPIILYRLMENFSASWRISYLICVAAMTALLPLLLYTFPGSKTPSKTTQPQEIRDNREIRSKNNKPTMIRGFIICMFVYVGIETGVSAYADAMFTLQLSAPQFGAYAIAAYWMSMAIGRFLFGQMKKIPKFATPISLLCIAGILFSTLFFRHEFAMLMLFAAAGLACSCVWPGIAGAAVLKNPDASGKVMSYLNLGAGLGGAIVPLIMGIVMDVSNIFFSFALLAALSTAAGIYIWKKA